MTSEEYFWIMAQVVITQAPGPTTLKMQQNLNTYEIFYMSIWWEKSPWYVYIECSHINFMF